jgi:hypothetical protein
MSNAGNLCDGNIDFEFEKMNLLAQVCHYFTVVPEIMTDLQEKIYFCICECMLLLHS